MKISVVSAIVVFAFATPGLASAQPRTGKSEPAMTIRYNDLDLRSAQGATEMLHRIRRVAVDYCQPGETGFEATARFETWVPDLAAAQQVFRERCRLAPNTPLAAPAPK